MRTTPIHTLSVLAMLMVGVSPIECLAAHSSVTIAPVINAKLSYPQTASAELGVAYPLASSSNDIYTGPFLSYEPGINGQKVHLGYFLASFGGSVPTDIQWVTGRISLSYFKPWKDTAGLLKNEDYYGLEFVGSYKILVLSVGGYYGSEQEKLIGAIGVGVGW